MTRAYEVYTKHEAAVALASLRRSARVAIIESIESLRQDPFQSGDVSGTGSDGLPWSAKIAGTHTIVYRVDHANREIRIAKLVEAPRKRPRRNA